MKKVFLSLIISGIMIAALSGCGMIEDGMITSSPMPTEAARPSEQPSILPSMNPSPSPSTSPDMGNEINGGTGTPSESHVPNSMNNNSEKSK